MHSSNPQADAAPAPPEGGHTPPRSAQGSPLFYRLALVLGALSALGPLAIDMYLPSFPAIARDFGTTPAAVQATLAFYFIGLASGQVFYGPVSDRWGRKPPLYFGLALFLLASCGCALATHIESLMTFRLVQALGGGASMVIARAVVRDHFGEHDAARLLSTLMLVMGLAPILAPLLGGQLVTTLGWRSIFWFQAAAAGLLLLGVFRYLPESLPPERRHRHGIGAIVGLYARLLRNRLFMADTLAASLMTAAMFSYISGSPFVFMEVYGVTPGHYGLFFGGNAFGLIATSQLTGRLLLRFKARDVLRVVLLVAAGAALLMLAAALTGIGGFAGILIPLFVAVSCQGLASPLTAALALAPQGKNAGTASALLGMLPFLAGAAGGSLVGALYDGSAAPMALVIAACAAGACSIHLLFGRKPLAAEAPARA